MISNIGEIISDFGERLLVIGNLISELKRQVSKVGNVFSNVAGKILHVGNHISLMKNSISEQRQGNKVSILVSKYFYNAGGRL